MSDFKPGEPVPYRNLTPEEWAATPRNDHSTLFTREEFLRAAQLVGSAAEAEEAARTVYNEWATRPGHPIIFPDEFLFALALTSPDAARRVRSVLNVSDEELEAHIARARRRWTGKAAGS